MLRGCNGGKSGKFRFVSSDALSSTLTSMKRRNLYKTDFDFGFILLTNEPIMQNNEFELFEQFRQE